MTAPRPASLDLSALHRVHLVGIGGMHMSAIGSILLARGVQVTGSDLAPSRYTERLQAEGATIYEGHAAEHLGTPDLVVATVAAQDTNPEIVAARERGIPVIIRAEMVAALMEGRRAVCIAGTHGKTTTTGLIAVALVEAGRDPTYLVGGDVVNLGRNAAAGSGPEIVVEADEYAEAFLHYRPDVALVTNVEVDHLDYYGTEQRLLGAFAAFLGRVRRDGLVVACADSPRLRRLLAEDATAPEYRVETYALDRPADWTAQLFANGSVGRFAVRHRQEPFGEFTTPLAGRHNVANCLGAIAVLHALGLKAEQIRDAIAGFRGAKRRFEPVGEVAGITVMDDYAHHPTEIAATLVAARERFPGRRLIAVFQPHTFSRTSYLLDGFRTAFERADALVLLQTFAARETAAAGLDGAALAREITRPRPAFVETQAGATGWLLEHTRPGDVVFTIGAGTVDAVGRTFVAELSKRQKAARP